MNHLRNQEHDLLGNGNMGMQKSNIWLVDAVCWDLGYSPSHSLRNVKVWFQQHFQEITLNFISADALIELGIPHQAEKIILSGSPRNAWDDDPFTLRLAERIQEISSRNLPFLGVCYGHQMLARAMGGHVEREPNGLEFGNASVTLTPAGEASPLFRGLPSHLPVLQSHSDAVTRLPESAELLATGKHTRVQSFKMGARMFGVQFHPETNPEILTYLWEPRIEKWQPKVSFDLKRKIESLTPAPEAARILQNFVELQLS